MRKVVLVLTILVGVLAALLGLVYYSVHGGAEVLAIRGFTVILDFDKEKVEKLIPPCLSLGPQSVSPSGKHPVVFNFQHLDVRLPLSLFSVKMKPEFTHSNRSTNNR